MRPSPASAPIEPASSHASGLLRESAEEPGRRMGVERRGARLHQLCAVLHEGDILRQRDQLCAGGAGLAHQGAGCV